MNIIQRVLADPNLQIQVNKTPLSPDSIRDNVLNWVGGIAGIIAFLYLIYGGFQYLTAAGNAEQAKKGGQTLVNAVLGLVIIALAYGLTAYIIDILNH